MRTRPPRRSSRVPAGASPVIPQAEEARARARSSRARHRQLHANVVGAPHLDLTYHGTAAPQKTWVYAQFVNPRNGTVLGNIATPIPLTLDGQTHSISRNLEMVAGRAPAGGGYTLQLTASSSCTTCSAPPARSPSMAS